MNPLVSVVVTTYNQAAYIEQTIDSTLSQTYKPFEVIVVDDGSTDDTQIRLTAYGEQIIYIRQKNQGVAGSRNTGIRKAHGEYIALLDGDDFWEPEKLSVQVSAARLNPNSGLIVVDGVMFDNSGTLETSLLFKPWCKDLPEGSVTTGCYYHQFLQGTFIYTTSQVMIPAKVFETVGMSDMRFKAASDYDLYIRIAARFDVTIIKEHLTRWRYLPSSVSGFRNLRALRYLPEDIAILRNHLRKSRGSDRKLIKDIIKTRLSEGVEKVKSYGLDTDKIFATRVLLKLLSGNPTSLVVASFLAGLWCPDAIKNKYGPAVRKMIFKNGIVS
ncbi:MAG: glycosyltransferase family 2 protein [Proteobacteria bacterium]|nr:glycosyltransferase family 2 protein [Pseudomonadota bacterium]